MSHLSFHQIKGHFVLRDKHDWDGKHTCSNSNEWIKLDYFGNWGQRFMISTPRNPRATVTSHRPIFFSDSPQNCRPPYANPTPMGLLQLVTRSISHCSKCSPSRSRHSYVICLRKWPERGGNGGKRKPASLFFWEKGEFAVTRKVHVLHDYSPGTTWK